MIKELQVADLNNFKILCEEYKANFFDLYNISNIFNNPFQKIYVYEQSKELVGFIFVEKLYETLNILHIYITSTYRNQKKASLLLDYVLSDSSIENIILEVNVNNKPAIKLYEKFGFQIINIREKYYNGIDAYVMEKRVQK
ncbi:MAG: GNAT family N-acetyltransferase [Bacilli bacterium]|nr:GNAT family N-acetyltransferase [Bacilli bacterium]